MKRLLTAFACGVALATGVAACGGDDEKSSETTPTVTTETETTPDTETTPTVTTPRRPPRRGPPPHPPTPTPAGPPHHAPRRGPPPRTGRATTCRRSPAPPPSASSSSVSRTRRPAGTSASGPARDPAGGPGRPNARGHRIGQRGRGAAPQRRTSGIRAVADVTPAGPAPQGQPQSAGTGSGARQLGLGAAPAAVASTLLGRVVLVVAQPEEPDQPDDQQSDVEDSEADHEDPCLRTHRERLPRSGGREKGVPLSRRVRCARRPPPSPGRRPWPWRPRSACCPARRWPCSTAAR